MHHSMINENGFKDWKDLWRLELAGRISMVNSPREVDPGKFNKVLVWRSEIGLCNSRVFQVRLFDSTHYLKAFGIRDVWVAVGWSSDVLPAVKRMSNVAVVVPKSGASLWADLWAIPAASRLETKQIGGRVSGPSPLIHQWIEFCLQTARALPFKQEVIPGTSPSALESTLVKLPGELLKGKYDLDIQEFENPTHRGNYLLHGDGDGYLRFQCARCAPKQGKRLTYPPMNENGWTNSDNSLLNDKSLFLGVGYIRHYHFK
ncbi:putrescine-binding periplasmic protein-related [Citrus sinensis]|uniref:Putrescine-binding periplasmic protein-related n=1 Tax=Citrus sinensis TaxID=2711 RepID=A0ACB8JG56_CITSI|nr:putrescine-binding periplasmic protein-related [Citrus sinensis]